MKIGMPKEIKENEFRVAIVPHNVSKLTSSGHQVYVETEAGLASGFTDEQYVKAGAEILPDAASVYKAGDMIVKVKEFLHLWAVSGGAIPELTDPAPKSANGGK